MNDVVVENLASLKESGVFDKLGDLMKEYVASLAKSQMYIAREVRIYGSILLLADFAKISEMIFFMSSREIYRHYASQSKKYKLLVSLYGKTRALEEVNQTAREETFRSNYPELINDSTLTIRRVTKSSDKVELISKYLISMLDSSVKIDSHQGLMTLDIIEDDGSHQIETISNYSRKSFAVFIDHMLTRVINSNEAEKIAAKVEESLSL